jgi:bacteriocin-like protein
MTDDFTILSDAELDQVSGGDNPYAPPPHTHYHGPGWYGGHQPSGVSAITPVRASWTFDWAGG